MNFSIYIIIALGFVGIAGCNSYVILGTVKHTNCLDRNSGGVNVTNVSTDGYLPIAHWWKHNGQQLSTTEDIENVAESLLPYNYRVRFSRSAQPTDIYGQKDFYVLNDVSWQNSVGVVLLNDGGVHNTSLGLGSALSFTQLPVNTNGFVETMINDGIDGSNSPNTAQAVLAFASGALPQDIRYLIEFERKPNTTFGEFRLRKFQNGILSASLLSGTYSNGDIFRLVKQGNFIRVWHNGTLYQTASLIMQPFHYLVRTLLTTGFKFEYVRTSYSCVDPDVYFSLSRTLDGTYYILNERFLKIKYEGEYNAGWLTYNVYDWKRHLIQTGMFAKKFGDNRIGLPLCGPQYIRNEIYTLEIANEKNEIFKLRFKFQGLGICEPGAGSH